MVGVICFVPWLVITSIHNILPYRRNILVISSIILSSAGIHPWMQEYYQKYLN